MAMNKRTKQYREIAHVVTRNIVRRTGTIIMKSKKDRRKNAKLYREIISEVNRHFREDKR